jgi:23S rRNA pseudouridine1911/1915/1917 synthase
MRERRPIADSSAVTIAAILRAQRPELSWNRCREFIASGRVSIAGEIIYDASRRFSADTPIQISDRGKRQAIPLPDLKVYFYDAHLVVVEKPSGMETVPFHTKNAEDDQKSEGETLIEVTRKWLEISEKQKIPPLRAVQRIDKGTSGIVIFARTLAAERVLGSKFRSHDLHRKYLAICYGTPEQGTIETYLAEDRGDGYRGSTPDADKGKKATTHIEILATSSRGYTFVGCTIDTGRTHQIRIHLCEAGHPICGDSVYRSPSNKAPKITDLSQAPRLALHAAELTIAHPISGKELSYQSPLPPDLSQFWSFLQR